MVYFEYKLITRNAQEKSREFYARDIERLEAEEQRIAYENSREENDDKHLSDQKLAFVENLNRSQLFELMQDRDPYSHIMIDHDERRHAKYLSTLSARVQCLHSTIVSDG